MVLPTRPLTRCVSCRTLSLALYCDNCKPTDERANASRRGYGRDWKRTRDRKLSMTPLCEVCGAAGRISPATEVHHEKSVREAPQLRLVLSNLVSVCHPCHMKIEGQRRKYRTAVMPDDYEKR